MGAGASVDALSLDGELKELLNYYDGNLESAADAVNREIVRVVPKTGSGRFVPERGEQTAVQGVVDRATKLARHGYAVAWEGYKAADGDAARQSADDFLAETRRLEEDFTPAAPPRCALPADASVVDLVALAFFNGRRLLESLEGYVLEAGGKYEWGPRKSKSRITQKAEEYGGDVARVVDVERATGIFDSVDDLSLAVSLLRAAARRGEITIRRCKDRFGHPFDSGYRDLQFNVELNGFVGELQLNLRRILQVKAKAHTVYEVERVIEAKADREALQRAVEGPGLESEQVLRLTIDGDRSVDDVFGSLAMFEAALARALPRGCVVANLYLGKEGDVRVRLGVDDVAAMARLRDDVIMGSTFEDALRRTAPRWERPATDDELRDMGFEACAATGRQEFYLNRASNVARRTRPTVPEAEARIRVDRGEFMECYARLMMRFSKLTPHQREKLEEVRAAKVAVLLAPAGGGKTFVAIQRMLQVLHGPTVC